MNEPSSQASRAYVWYVIALLAGVNVFNYMDRMALAVLLPAVKQDLQLSDGQLGLLVGFAFSLFYAIGGVPIARLADKGVRRNIIAVALAGWSVMTALCGAAQNFVQLFLARVGVGVGEAGSLPPAQSILCDYVPLQRRPGVFALQGFGLIVGMMLGMALPGWLATRIGWRGTMVVLGLPGLLLALLVRYSLREPKRGSLDPAHAEEPMALMQTLSVLWHCRTYRLLTLLYALNGFVQYGLNQWWPSYYTRVFGMSMSSVGIALGIAIGVGSGIGLLLGGWMANRAAQSGIGTPLVVSAIATTLAAPAALGTLFLPHASDSILFVGLTGLLWSISNGTVVATATSVVAAQMRATAGAINILFAAVLGFGLGPFCVGLLSDALTPTYGSEALRYALLAPICMLPVMTLVLYAAARSLPNDLREQAVMQEQYRARSTSRALNA